MKLETSIKPRSDGTVSPVVGGVKYTFKAGTDGALGCEVDNAAHAAILLNSGNFYPADEADFDDATDLLGETDAGGETDGDMPPPDDIGLPPPIDLPRKPKKNR